MDPLILFKLEQGKASSDLQSIEKLTHMKKYNKIIMRMMIMVLMIIIVAAAIIINTKTNIKLREQSKMSDKDSIIITTYKLI